MRFGQKKVPEAFWLVIFFYLSYCLFFTPNFWVTIPVALFPVFAFRLLWVDNQPNVLFFGMMMQWLASATQIFYCNIARITLVERMSNTVYPGEKMNDATTFSMIGLYFFALGLFIIVRKINLENINLYLQQYSPRKILMTYIVISIVIYFTSGIIWAFPSLVQYFYFFFYIKWGFFVIAFYSVFKFAPLLKTILFVVLGVETILSFASFFAGDFLNIALYILICVILLQPRISFRSYMFIIIGAVILLHFLILWTSVKGEYRSFVTKGEASQSITVTRGEANAKLYELITNVSDEKYQDGVDKFVDRLGYIQYFGATLDYVPKTIPHQNGAIYLSAVQHYLVPRFLNPNKAVLDDSKHTQQFTGIGVSGAENATSFSLGYIADAYIDFGPIYMYVALLLFGVLFGVFFRFLYLKAANEVWSWILTTPFFLLLNINGADTKKALGWILIYFIVVAVVRKILFKKIDPFMKKKIIID